MRWKEDMLLSVVVPVYNEEGSLEQLHREVAGALRDARFEIIFVDDGSSDRSYEVCCALQAQDPARVVVIRLRRNFGQTAALAAGFDAAAGDVLIPIDADLQNDPEDIPRLVEALTEGYDVVSGWRARRRDPLWSRRIPSRAANWLISAMTGVRLHDYGCTLKAYRRDVVRDMHLYGEMHRFLPALAHWVGAAVTELPVNHRPRIYGVSKYGIGRTLKVVLDLITVKFLVSYSTKPMQVFGSWGFCAIGVGLAAALITLIMKIVPPHYDITGNALLYIAMLFLLGGLQLIGMGLLGEINVRTYYESQRKPVYTVREQRPRQIVVEPDVTPDDGRCAS